jgi:hypothetical protein
VKIDELLQHAPQLAPWRPKVGIAPKLSDAELVTLAVIKPCSASPPRPAGCATPTATCDTGSSLPRQAGYNKRLRARRRCCATPSGRSPPTPACGPTTSGSSTPPRWSAAAPRETTSNATAAAPLAGVAVRVLQPILALAAAIWHNHKTGQPTLRSLVAYDH